MLCVDDCSTDGSLAIARASAGDDRRFRLIPLETTGGQSVARNLPPYQARGHYIVLLDADDYLLPEAHEKLVERVHSHNLAAT